MKKLPFLLKLKKWDIRLLSADNQDEIQKFIRLFDDFFELCEGEKGSAEVIFSACPPSKNIREDKFVLGVYDQNILIGILDIIRDYPEKEIWTIGYLLIHPNYRNQRIGSCLIRDLRHSLQKITLRCIVQEQNMKALNFWKSNGFTIVNQRKEKLGQITNTINILESREF
ncbi:GNAT family N-acetyltransferase [Legionella yabuuchiae]|uniref:GNAT family N-acetyltransferase n=1 Tax=Legionella yabuuchiae TaxID=376727 RepID=UPI0013EFABF4|nr:GNAT family N-acetyltransferase [Legionella yabuuchiae]